MKDKRAITWKDADIALCTLAAAILDQAGLELRTDYGTGVLVHDVDREPQVTRGFASSDPMESWWSYMDPYLEQAQKALGEEPPYNWRIEMPPLCWWSFQNLVKARLKQARQELYKALYGKGNSFKTSKQKSRNPLKRSSKSKFGRKPI